MFLRSCVTTMVLCVPEIAHSSWVHLWQVLGPSLPSHLFGSRSSRWAFSSCGMWPSVSLAAVSSKWQLSLWLAHSKHLGLVSPPPMAVGAQPKSWPAQPLPKFFCSTLHCTCSLWQTGARHDTRLQFASSRIVRSHRPPWTSSCILVRVRNVVPVSPQLAVQVDQGSYALSEQSRAQNRFVTVVPSTVTVPPVLQSRSPYRSLF